MPKLLVLGDDRKPGVVDAVGRLRRWAEHRDVEITHVDLNRTLDLATVTADLAVTLGGDGTILGVARRLAGNRIPVVGVNFGKFGFLAAVRANEMEAVLDRVLAGEYVEHERMMLACRVIRPGGSGAEITGLNDVVIGRASINHMIRVHMSVDGAAASTYAGDGLIVATPVGSTAYAMAAGGPIVEPELDAIVITPICPHALTNRTVVLRPDRAIRLRLEEGSSAHVSVDGQEVLDVDAADVVEIARAPHRFVLRQPGDRSYYEILRARFNWGGSPNYEESRS